MPSRTMKIKCANYAGEHKTDLLDLDTQTAENIHIKNDTMFYIENTQ